MRDLPLLPLKASDTMGVSIFDIDAEGVPKFYGDAEGGRGYAFFMGTFPEKYQPLPPPTKNSVESLSRPSVPQGKQANIIYSRYGP